VGAGHAVHGGGPSTPLDFDTDTGDAQQGSGAALHHASSLLLRPLLGLLSLPVLLAFVTWFGAAGYLATRYGALSLAMALLLAALAGVAASFLMAKVIARLRAGETFLGREAYRMEGTVARVAVPIPPDAPGEIVFTKAGVRRGEAARSLDGQPIARGEEVVVVRYERGVAHVQRWTDFMAAHDQQARSSPSAATERA
jgi:membrane protein implicated in regulation of membrane protease activity